MKDNRFDYYDIQLIKTALAEMPDRIEIVDEFDQLQVDHIHEVLAKIVDTIDDMVEPKVGF